MRSFSASGHNFSGRTSNRADTLAHTKPRRRAWFGSNRSFNATSHLSRSSGRYRMIDVTPFVARLRPRTRPAAFHCAKSFSVLPERLESSPSSLGIDFSSFIYEFFTLFFHSLLQRRLLGESLFGGVFADVFSDFHGAEVRATH